MTIGEFIRATAESLERRRRALALVEQARDCLWAAHNEVDEPMRTRLMQARETIDYLAMDIMMDSKISEGG